MKNKLYILTVVMALILGILFGFALNLEGKRNDTADTTAGTDAAQSTRYDDPDDAWALPEF